MKFGRSQQGSRRPMQQNLRRARKAMKKMVQIAEDENQNEEGVLLSDGRSFKKQKGVLPRKQRRKEARRLKKAKKHAFLTGKNLSDLDGEKKKKVSAKKTKSQKNATSADPKTAEKKARREEKIKMEKEEQRKRELLAANEDEDKNIRRLEKELNFRKKRKTKEKITPTAFKDDGLDYLLDIVDPRILEAAMDEELMDLGKNTEDSEEEEEEGEEEDSGDEGDDGLEEDSDGSKDAQREDNSDRTTKRKSSDEQSESRKKSRLSDEEDGFDSEEDGGRREDMVEMFSSATKKSLSRGKQGASVDSMNKPRTDIKRSKHNFDDEEDDDDEEEEEEEDEFDDSDEGDDDKTIKMDPYGNIIGEKVPEKTSTYIPPHKRAEMMGQSVDAEKRAKMDRLRKQLKGAINRLSESNALSISNQIEELYLTNSRNDMNESLSALIQDACISGSLTPDRLVMEHILLIAVLHSVVGNEVGAHLLQSIATRFDRIHCDDGNYGDSKEIDNIIMVFVHLYNFRIVNCVLIYDLIKKLAESFTERHIEMLLQILKSAGTTLRKDDPSSLKDIILLIQSKANHSPDELKQQSRVKFMLETIGALRNNNLRRIPNYDPSNLDRLRKLHRSIIKDRGCSDSMLRISLADLIMANERGRWWIVGSAWSGHGPKQDVSGQTSAQLDELVSKNQEVSHKISELSRQQRMNTDIRRTIFSIIMTAEDYTDAFEKLVRLGQKGGRDREVVHVTLDCCQQERCYNPYYAYLSDKLCQFDRKFRMAFQFALWDKIRLLEELSPSASKNLALLLSHLISSKALPLSVLKIVEFADMNKHTVRFLNSLLTDLLLEKPDNLIASVFGGVATVTKLRVLREGLGLFMHHFLLNANRKKMMKGGGEESMEKLKKKISIAECAMQGEDGPVKL